MVITNIQVMLIYKLSTYMWLRRLNSYRNSGGYIWNRWYYHWKIFKIGYPI